MLKKLITNSLLFGIAPYVPQVVSVFLLPIMTKYLTATDYGIAGTINAYTQALTAFSTLGFATVLSVVFFRSKCQYKVLWREIYGFLQFWMIIFAILQGMVLYFIMPEAADEHKWLIIVLTNFSNVLFGPTAIIGSSYYTLSMKPLPVVTRSMLSGLITVMANYILVVHFRLGYLGWYVSGFLGTFVSNASYWYSVNYTLKLSPIYRFKRRTILKYLKIAMPTIPHFYTVFLFNSSSKLVMDFYSVPLPIFGQANIMTQIGGVMESWVSAINQAINPMMMTEIRGSREQRARSLAFVYLAVVYFCTFTVSLWSKEIFGFLLSNPELAATYPYAIIFIMALNYRPMYVAASNMFFYHEKTASLLKITFTAGIMAFVLYCLLIPFFEIWGIVIGYYIAAFYYGYSGFFMRVFREHSKVAYPVFKIACMHLALTVVAFMSVECDAQIKVVITLCFAACMLLKVAKLRK